MVVKGVRLGARKEEAEYVIHMYEPVKGKKLINEKQGYMEKS